MTEVTADRPPPPGLRPRERLTILAALAAVTGLSWLYLYLLAAEMAAPGAMAGLALAAEPKPWTAAELVLMFVMWWVMMVGMMVPSAAPMILTFATINRRKRERGQDHLPTAVFTAGYLLAWGAFSLLATLIQWGLATAALLSPMMETTSPMLGGGLFIAAGIYQLTPLKHACLKHCRSPLDFVLNHWREGALGALRMGAGHGLYCLGCCWFLMALLFVGGVMNLVWVAAIAAFVFIEKLFVGGRWTASFAGGAMLAFGAYLIV
ncbi:MAG: DUF2182 domain-containing protein [Alphaproteobacteria bacterium]|jgi:predicted metal-binding membrane protein|nr:DUF2182 domain-containing protein [Alphaproteobacteria bacterium]MDP6812822.1 DUF2182 domain-containing protein [Alphaproteobacteria bacterium]